MSLNTIQQSEEDQTPCSTGRAEFLRHLFRFVVIGVLSVATDFVCYQLLMAWGLSPHVAKGLSYISGMTVGFFGNKYWTFESNRRSLSEVFAFCGLYLTTLAINVAINGLVLHLLGSESILPAYLAATAVSTVTNFLGLRLLIFRVQPSLDEPLKTGVVEAPRKKAA